MLEFELENLNRNSRERKDIKMASREVSQWIFTSILIFYCGLFMRTEGKILKKKWNSVKQCHNVEENFRFILWWEEFGKWENVVIENPRCCRVNVFFFLKIWIELFVYALFYYLSLFSEFVQFKQTSLVNRQLVEIG